LTAEALRLERNFWLKKFRRE